MPRFTPNPYSAHIPPQHPSASGPDGHLRNRQDPMNALPPRATMKGSGQAIERYHNEAYSLPFLFRVRSVPFDLI